MPSSGWLSSIKKRQIDIIQKNDHTGQFKTKINGGQKINHDDESPTEERKLRNHVPKRESVKSPPSFQVPPVDPHIPADFNEGKNIQVIEKSTVLLDSSREAEVNKLPQCDEYEPTEEKPTSSKKSRKKLVRSQSQEITPRTLKSSETLLAIGYNSLIGKISRPASAISRLSGYKESVVRVSVSASGRQASPTPECIVPVDNYTAPGYSDPLRNKNSQHGTDYPSSKSQISPSTIKNINKRPRSGSSILRYLRQNSSESILDVNMEKAKKIDRPTTSSETVVSGSRANESDEEECGVSVSPFPVLDIEPLYTEKAQPSPSVSGMITPMFEADPKKVRFVEPKDSAPVAASRPSSAVSQYSNIVKNSTRYHYQASQAYIETFGHDPRVCNCPCHFLKAAGRRSVAVQAYPNYKNGRLLPGRTLPLRPRHSRLLVFPSVKNLEGLSVGAKGATLMIRMLLSQVGVAIMLALWWGLGALMFASLEGPSEKVLVKNMEKLKSEIVIDLATDLRKVVPHDELWKSKISHYMGRFEFELMEAARSGYTSKYHQWNLPGSFIYSVSLSALVGPNGSVIRSNVTKLISLPYSIIGCILMTLLTVNISHLIREGLAKIWCPWRRRRKIHAAPLQGVESETPPQSLITARAPHSNFGHSKVLTLDETLDQNKFLDSPSSTDSLHRMQAASSTEEQLKIRKIEKVRPISGGGNSEFLSYENASTIAHSERTNMNLGIPSNAAFTKLPRVGAPWYFYFILIIIHCISFITLFHLLFQTDPWKTAQGIIGSTITLEPGNWFYEVETPSWYISGACLGHILIGRILMTAFLYSIWPVLSRAFSSLVKEVLVSIPVMIRS